MCVSEVTVKDSDLKLCKDDDKVCVTDLRDCGPRPPSSVQSEYGDTVRYLDVGSSSSFFGLLSVCLGFYLGFTGSSFSGCATDLFPSLTQPDITP